MLRAFANRLETRIIFTSSPSIRESQLTLPNRLNTYLASDRELRLLSSRARQLTLVQRHYQAIAPANLYSSSKVLQLNQQMLILAAFNGAVASKLRQMTEELISLFQARGCEVTGIQIRVQVVSPAPQYRPVPRSLSKAAHEALGKLDEDLADSPLKTALERLMKH
ncbi:MAG TPA: hypothetical protein DCK83_14095 [Gallionellaceae bacterium]|nr:hypothetical protein [Gallionellaceae bacterium]